jgi:hypothetical protein
MLVHRIVPNKEIQIAESVRGNILFYKYAMVELLQWARCPDL